MTKKNALKKVRGDSRRHERNKSVRSEVKTLVARAEKLILTGDVKAAGPAVTAAVSTLDKAASGKVIHANNAARRKARLVKKLNTATAAGAAAESAG